MEISENLGFMYGQNFKSFTKYVRIAAGIHQNSQNLLGLPIWPQKMPNLFGLATKMAISLGSLPDDAQTVIYDFLHSVNPISITCHTSALLACCYNSFQFHCS
jgi:hypothetical protein